MRSEQRWGHSVWTWRVLALSAAASVALLLLSLTVSGRVFSVMLLVFEAGVAASLFLGWARSERERFELEAAFELEADPLD
jgi:hypothetical protein